MKIQKKKIWKSLEPIILGIFLAIFIKTFFLQAYIIPSGSMMDTLLIGDCLLASKITYNIKIPFSNKILIKISKPKRYDIVIFKYPKNEKINYIKRVIGLPGETIKIINRTTFVNNIPITENYAIHNKLENSMYYPKIFGPIKIPKNNLFVMGDNRNNSSDSRRWGFVNTNNVIGKALIIYWSWDKHKLIPRFNRILNLL